MSGNWAETVAKGLSADRPVLIAGPTASGKSALAMAVAERLGGPVVNADALQVYADWRVLTARPSAADEARLTHRLYGHVPGARAYSVGQWLREVTPLLDGPPPVIVGGTGLYFTALTEGLADIPPTPEAVRAEADARSAETLLAELDSETAARIDRRNPVRVQRAWEVLRTTGRGLAAWQDGTGPPLLPLAEAETLLVHAPPDWLGPRIAARLRQMVEDGALEEARVNAPGWSPERPSAKAIGAAEFVAVAREEIALEEALSRAEVQTRQYAKRQRTWFRRRMADWRVVDATGGAGSSV